MDYMVSYSSVGLYFTDGTNAVAHFLPLHDNRQFTNKTFASTIEIVNGPPRSRISMLRAGCTLAFSRKE